MNQSFLPVPGKGYGTSTPSQRHESLQMDCRNACRMLEAEASKQLDRQVFWLTAQRPRTAFPWILPNEQPTVASRHSGPRRLQQRPCNVFTPFSLFVPASLWKWRTYRDQPMCLYGFIDNSTRHGSKGQSSGGGGSQSGYILQQVMRVYLKVPATSKRRSSALLVSFVLPASFAARNSGAFRTSKSRSADAGGFQSL